MSHEFLMIFISTSEAQFYTCSVIILFIGRNQVNETTRHGIVAHRLWDENLGNGTKVIVTDSFGFIAQSL